MWGMEKDRVVVGVVVTEALGKGTARVFFADLGTLPQVLPTTVDAACRLLFRRIAAKAPKNYS